MSNECDCVDKRYVDWYRKWRDIGIRTKTLVRGHDECAI
jgi:hypothetical protein